jgi:hypothetical protein
MRIADILRTLANNLEHAQGAAPDPRIQNPAELIDVEIVGNPESGDKTASGNDKSPEELFVPPLQQKIELLKKAVDVENIYDDGQPSEEDAEPEQEDALVMLKKAAGINPGVMQELTNDEPLDD